jgi:hypothetical protein
MPRVRFEPTIPAFEREKAVHVSDRAAPVIGTRRKGPINNWIIYITEGHAVA